jgi:hypothetical protein
MKKIVNMNTSISKKLKKAMFQAGHLPPENEEELAIFDIVIKKKDLPKLPELFNNPMNIIRNGAKLNKNLSQDAKAPHNYAMAAREGVKSIAQEVLDKMRNDRENAETKKSD